MVKNGILAGRAGSTRRKLLLCMGLYALLGTLTTTNCTFRFSAWQFRWTAKAREREGGEIGMNGGTEEERLPKTEANVLRGHEGGVLAARFNSDGNYCLSCGKDRTLRLWNPHRGIHIKTYKSHGREVRDVHVTLDNAKLCSCGGDRQVFYWDVSTGRVIRKFRGHDSEVHFLVKMPSH